jgi:hypothetical protein
MVVQKSRPNTSAETHKKVVPSSLSWIVVILTIVLLGSIFLTRSPSPKSAVVDPRPAIENGRLFLTEQDIRSVTMPNGDRQKIASLLHVDGPMRYGQFHWNAKDVPAGQIWIRVELSTQLMSVFQGEHEIGTGVILFGADSHPTPIGRFPIMAKLKDHESSIYDAKMPYTLRLTGDGVAIHGSNVRRGAATHGCIGIPTEFAAHVFDAVKISDPVFILR